jgi:hypothetical protein
MDLIKLYTQEVGLRLPEKDRADIEKEIRSLIEDALEDESSRAGRPVDEAMTVEVLKRMGPPRKMAASYLPPRYLIGPELFPHYLTSLRVVLAVVAVVMAIAIGTSLGAVAGTGLTIFDVVGRLVSGLLDAIFRAAAIVTLIFAIIQFASPDFKVAEKEWDPRKMKARPDSERVNLAGSLFDILVATLALVIFNFYPHLIGIATMVDGEWVQFGLLSEAFFGYLPYLNVLWVAEIVHNAWLAAQGRWTVRGRWVQIVLSVLTVMVLAWMLTGPALVRFPAEEAGRLSASLTPEALERINDGVGVSIRLVLGLVMALQLVEAGKQLYKLVGKRLPVAVAGE